MHYIGGVLMEKVELKQLGEYVGRDELDIEEAENLKLLLLKWMYEQGMLQ